MGLGPPTRSPCAFLESLGYCVSWKDIVRTYDEIVIAIDTNVVFNMLVFNDDATFKTYAEYFDSTIKHRLKRFITKLLQPILPDIQRGKCIETTIEPEEKQKIIIFLASDNGSPKCKYFAHQRRKAARLSNPRNLLTTVGALHYFVTEFRRLLIQITRIDVVTALSAFGEGEYHCIKFLCCLTESPYKKRLNVVASSDSDVLLYGLKAFVSNGMNINFLVLNRRMWKNSGVANGKHHYVLNIGKFATDLLATKVDVNCYIILIVALIGNDYLPSILSSSISFSQIHDLVSKFSRQPISVNSHFYDLLSVAAKSKMIKSSTKIDVCLNDRVKAIKELWNYADTYFKYISSACEGKQCINTDTLQSLQLGVTKYVSQCEPEAEKFMKLEPMKNFLLLNRAMSETSWKVALKKILSNEIFTT